MGSIQTKLLELSVSKAAVSVLTCTSTGLFWWRKAGAFLFLLYVNNFRVFGFLVPKGTKQFSASENVSLTVSSSQRGCKVFFFTLLFMHQENDERLGQLLAGATPKGALCH